MNTEDSEATHFRRKMAWMSNMNTLKKRRDWALEHYEGKPICVDCAKFENNCAFAPTSACSFFTKKKVG